MSLDGIEDEVFLIRPTTRAPNTKLITHPMETNEIMRPGIPRLERWIAAALFSGALILRLLYAWHFRIDSDEPQHLHVVWAWANGLLPYRDLFDNHSPLFQALNAPLFHFLGVRPDILLPMRLGMIPIFALTIGCVWKISASFFSPRTALWTALLATFLPPYFLNSVEFRPDQLWTLVWLLTLSVLVTKRATPGRAFIAGLLLGVAFSVSMKSSLMLVTLALALAGSLAISHRSMHEIPWRKLAQCVGAGLAGLAIVPTLVTLFFVSRHAGNEMYYCVIQHNILPSPPHFGRMFKSTLRFLAAAPFLIAGTVIIARLAKPAAARNRIVFLFLAANLYCLTLVCYWPVLTAEDYLPFFPAWMITAGPAAIWLAQKAGTRLRRPELVPPTLLVLAVLAETVCIFGNQSPLEDQTADKIGIVADTLKLTGANDFVMDSKGETIYRKRPFPYVLEKMTFSRIRAGFIEDNIAECLTQTHTPLASLQRVPLHGHEFISENYLPVAFRLLALGKFLQNNNASPGSPCVFHVAVSSSYTLVCPSGQPTGILDGTPFDGPRELAVGRHEFTATSGAAPVALIWAQAAQRGYSPFSKIKPNHNTPQD